MSLRAKVFLLFATFAVAPLLLIGVFDYIHSVVALASLVEGENRNLANRVAADLDHAVQPRLDDLGVLAATSPVRRILTGQVPAAAAPALLTDLARRWPWVKGLELRGPDGRLVARSGAFADPAQCEAGHQRLLRLRRPVMAGDDNLGMLTAHAAFGDVFPPSLYSQRMGAGGQVIIINRATGRVLNHRDCRTLASANSDAGAAGPLRVAAMQLTAPRVARYAEGTAQREAAIVPVASGTWAVASILVPTEFTGPYGESRMMYLLLVVVIALGTALAFSLLLKRVMRSLTELIGAADQIADGNFMPWLPLPGSDEVGRLTVAFGGMASRLRELVQQLEVTRPLAVIGEFAPNLAHEIRNPLSSIRLNLQDMARSVNRGRVPADLREPVEICLNEVNRLDRVVQGVLRLVQPNEEETRERVSIHDCVLDTTRMLTAEMRARAITLKLDLTREGDGFLKGDPAQVQSVFINLVRNAMEAMPDGGPLHIWTVWDRSGITNVMRVHIRDDGPGVAQDIRNQVFQPFFTTKPDGTGLGLPHSLRTVREHGGRLYLENRSELERGAEFVVELPAVAAGGSLPDRAPRPAAPLPSIPVPTLPRQGTGQEQTELALRS